MKFGTVWMKDLISHDNWSAEFWANHDPKKCKICKRLKNES